MSRNSELSIFWNKAAALAKALIRARHISEPDFLTKKQYEGWGLSDFGKERSTAQQLVKKAVRLLMEIDGHHMDFCPSGGFSVSDEWDESNDTDSLKIALANFVDGVTLKNLEQTNPIPWSDLAHWNALPALRRALDRLKLQLQAQQDGPTPTGEIRWHGKTDRPQPLVFRLIRIFWAAENPIAVDQLEDEVWGKEVQAPAVKALLCRANRSLEMVGVPWRLSQRDGYVRKVTWQ